MPNVHLAIGSASVSTYISILYIYIYIRTGQTPYSHETLSSSNKHKAVKNDSIPIALF